jgi:hypothetical protein
VREEAKITINGTELSDKESMTVRVAIDTLGNVLAEGLEESDSKELAELYVTALGRIQTLLENRETRKQ